MLAVLRNTAEAAVNGKGRSAGHIATGAALVTGAVALSALIAAANAPTPANPRVKADYDRLKQPGFKPPEKTFAVVWPPNSTIKPAAQSARNEMPTLNASRSPRNANCTGR